MRARSKEQVELFQAGAYDQLPLLITPSVAEAALGVSAKSLLRMVGKGQLRGVQIGRCWKINRDDLLTYCGLVQRDGM